MSKITKISKFIDVIAFIYFVVTLVGVLGFVLDYFNLLMNITLFNFFFEVVLISFFSSPLCFVFFLIDISRWINSNNWFGGKVLIVSEMFIFVVGFIYSLFLLSNIISFNSITL